MLLMTLRLDRCWPLLAALFASGVIGRTVHRTDAAIDAMVADAGFGISEIHLSGNAAHRAGDHHGGAGLQPGQSIFAADLPAARARLLALDWVADADVMRRYPDDISVTSWRNGPLRSGSRRRRLAVVERTGGLITDQDVEKFAHLPLAGGRGRARARRRPGRRGGAASRHRRRASPPINISPSGAGT